MLIGAVDKGLTGGTVGRSVLGTAASVVEQETGAVGARVRAVRRGAGLTQKQLAAALGVESITVSRWERGVTSPSLARLRRIGELTGTSMSELVWSAGTVKADAAELAALRRELAETRELVKRVAQALERLASSPSSAASRRGSRTNAT